MGKRTWLEEDLRDRVIPLLRGLEDNAGGHRQAENLCKNLRSGWVEKGLKTLKQQQSLIDVTRATIKRELGSEHFSLNWVGFTREENYELNQEKQGNARTRQLHQQYLTNPDAIVAMAVKLLDSPEWAEVAAGLAVLTGRRLNEVLRTAEFEIKSQWVVTFRGALKRRGEEVPLVFDIPTLTTAKRVMEATEKLRRITPADANEEAVGRMSDRYFVDLVPLPSGKSNIYTHLWRSVFACIATFWYCPKHVDDLLFKSHILGHFETLPASEQQDGMVLRQRLETFASDRHYRLYEIDDTVIEYHKGKRKGIKLGHGGVEPLEVFVGGMPENQPQPVERKHRSSLRVWREDHELVAEVLGRFEGKTQQDKVARWVRWSVQQLQKQPAAVEPESAIEPELEPESAPQEETEAIQSEPIQTIEPIQSESTPAPTLETKIDTLVSAIAQLVDIQTKALTAPTPIATPAPATMRRATTPTAPTALAQAEAKAEGQPEPERKYKSKGENDQLINQAIDAIIRHNDQAQTHDEKWEITLNALKAWTTSQYAIARVLEARADEIAAHHTKHQIGEKHNLRHRRKAAIDEVINLD